MMLDLQSIIAGFIILAALLYAASILLRKTKAFSRKADCADDCGCSSKSKTPKPAH
jgi:hypothetical protein